MPGRPTQVERSGMQPGGLDAQLAPIPRGRQGDFADVELQVELGVLKDNLADFAGRQISWNYTGHNNPYFITNQNSNRDKQTG